ncbi:MAG: DUF1571 domain-containing protein [Gemmataceae bacterium]|nr:DUF1571 domain-containing protein [Gemmataceae bacterium]
MHRCPRVGPIASRLPGMTVFFLCGALGAALLALLPSPGSSQTPVAAPLPPAASPLDNPLRLLAEAKQAYQGVRDYTCLFVKREQVRGQTLPENVMTMKVKTQPFSVYLRWQAPKNLEGQEVCYVVGKNNGQMRVHSSGVLGIAGWVSLDLNDPRALETSRHTIAEAGIGNLIDKYTERWTAERPIGRSEVKMAEYDFAKRRCIRVDVTHPGSKPGEFYAYRGVLYVDKETKLPIRSECYDWPRQGGPPDGDLLECFSYVDLKLNVGVPAEAFNY